MWRCLPVVLAACSFEHGAAGLQPPGDTPTIRDAPGDGPRDAFVKLDGKVFLDAPAPGPITFVQGNFFGPGLNAATASAMFLQTQQAHDLDIVVVSWSGAAASVTSVTDLEGNTYTRVATEVAQGADVLDVYYAADIAGGAGNIVTATFDAVVANPEVRILEYSGIATSMPLDGSSSGQAGNSTGVATGTFNTTHANDLVIGCEASGDSVKTLGTGYTLRVTASGDDVADKILSATATVSFAATLNNNAPWEARVMAFKGLQ